MCSHFKGEIEDLMQKNVSFSKGLVTCMGWMAHAGSVAGVEG